MGIVRHLVFATLTVLLITELAMSTEERNDNVIVSTTNTDGKRDGKVFSLFSIVTFKNSGCRSQSALTTGQSTARNGTCFTSSECSSKGGTASGNCAAGFGVCCIFLITSGPVVQNCSYIRNPGFPTTYSATTSISHQINKCSTDICYFRLDFETFALVNPASEALGCTIDSLKIVVSSGQKIPEICGYNTGQHIYVNVGDTSTDTATLSFAFKDPSTIRNWEIKVSQIECSNLNRPPDGCLQYFTTPTGRITTFNFFSTSDLVHLANQDVTACIRRQPGYCCIQYQVCPEFVDNMSGFSLDGNVGSPTAPVAPSSLVDSECSLDYTVIPGGAATCTNALPTFNKFCAVVLDTLAGQTSVPSPICDCTPPFMVHFHTDNADDTAPNLGSRGNCLDYTEVPC